MNTRSHSFKTIGTMALVMMMCAGLASCGGCSIEDYVYFGLNMIHNTGQFDVTGHPAISVPCGMEDGLPIGMMIVGRHFDDMTVIRVADAFEKIGNWQDM